MTNNNSYFVDNLIQQHGREKHSIIPLLQSIQDEYNYLPSAIIDELCKKTDITLAQVTSVSTFYSQFRHEATGEHMIRVCVGTACHVKGADLVYNAFKRHLDIPEDKETDKTGEFTVEKVSCLGCCTIAPVVQIDDRTYGHVSPEKVAEVIHDFLETPHDKASGKKVKVLDDDKYEGELRIGLGSCCMASGSDDVRKSLATTLEKSNINVKVKHVGCVGMCHQVPLLEIVPKNDLPVLYSKVTPELVPGILESHFRPTGLKQRLQSILTSTFEKLLFSDQGNTGRELNPRDDHVDAFLGPQLPIATEFRGLINPLDIEEYINKGGFEGFYTALKHTRQEIIDMIKESGVRGRGGGGFQSWKKWQLVHDAESDKKIVICNGDEGDPGAFMDRMLLESYPYRIIEGMLIACYATGSTSAIFYIRDEYPLAVSRITRALEYLKEKGILSNLDSKEEFSADFQLFKGAGAFICGEETALIASIEGQRGFPRLRPPYPSHKGLWGKPTLVNNTETFSLIPWIMKNTPSRFNKIGVASSTGTKVFALAGKVARGGLIEVPMGITIRQVVDEIGGGVARGKKFKAVQIGGPSGGCIPESLADTPIDFESLTKVGAMMGSGGLVVLDEDDCMVDIAKYFLSFTMDQSCGKCTFCRIGTRRMYDMLNKISLGNGKMSDIQELEDLAHQIKKGSLCGLGRSAPNPVLTTLHYFLDEYKAHIEGHCPAKKCQALIKYTISDNCIGCTKCAVSCPVDAIEFKPYELHEIDTEKCIKCDSCRLVCPVDAIHIVDHQDDTK